MCCRAQLYTNQPEQGVVCTYIDVLQECPVHCRPDHVGRVALEKHMAAIVALVEGGQDVITVVRPVAVRLYDTDLVSLWRARYWQPRRVGGGADIGPPRETRLCGCARGCCKGS